MVGTVQVITSITINIATPTIATPTLERQRRPLVY